MKHPRAQSPLLATLSVAVLAVAWPLTATAADAAPAAAPVGAAASGTTPSTTATPAATPPTGNSNGTHSASINYGNSQAITSEQLYAGYVPIINPFGDSTQYHWGFRVDLAQPLNSPSTATYVSTEATQLFTGLVGAYLSPFCDPNDVKVGISDKSHPTDRRYVFKNDEGALRLYTIDGIGIRAIQTSTTTLTLAPMGTIYVGFGFDSPLGKNLLSPVAQNLGLAAKTADNAPPADGPGSLNIQVYIAENASNRNSLNHALNVTGAQTFFPTFGVSGALSISNAMSFSMSYGAGVGGAHSYIKQTVLFSLSYNF